jgi:hypothetical protein
MNNGYLSQCKAGKSFIFSLKKNSERMLTIEITKDKRIIQSLGKFNRRASNPEKSTIRRWAIQNGLSLYC